MTAREVGREAGRVDVKGTEAVRHVVEVDFQDVGDDLAEDVALDIVGQLVEALLEFVRRARETVGDPLDRFD